MAIATAFEVEDIWAKMLDEWSTREAAGAAWPASICVQKPPKRLTSPA